VPDQAAAAVHHAAELEAIRDPVVRAVDVLAAPEVEVFPGHLSADPNSLVARDFAPRCPQRHA